MLSETKRQAINLYNCCIWLVNFFELYDDAWTCQRKKRYRLISEKLKKKMLWYGKIYNSCHFLFMTCRLLDDISVVLTNHPNTKQSLQCHLQLCVQVFRGSLRYIEQDMCNYLNVTHTNMYTYLVQVYAIMMIMFLHIYCLLCPLNMSMAINRQDHVVFFY